MTEEQKQQRRDLKQHVSEYLSANKGLFNSRYKYALHDTDKRIGEYVSGIIDHPTEHNL